MGELALATATARPDASGEEADGGIVIDRKNAYAAGCKWAIANFSKCKQRTLWSKYFEVGGYDCRLLVYPQGDSQALPGYVSIYLQVTDPGGASGKWDCFASYRLCVVNQLDDSRSIARDSWHRYSSKKKSHGWCDFTPAAALQDGRQGFALSDTVIVTADILLLNESVSFSREADLSNGVGPASPEVLSGKFTWKVHNFPQFLAMMKTQKVMSPVFPAGECNLRLSVYQSTVGGTEYLSKCLESRDADKAGGSERSCWCLFRMSVLNQLVGGKHLHRDSYGRFAADSKAGDNTSLGWNDFMPMANFIDSEQGYTVDGTAIFSASFHIIKESSTFTRNFDRSGSLVKGRGKPKGAGGGVGGDGGHQSGKFTWKIEHFTRLKELLKKRKITGLCIKSKRFQVGGRDCRLIVYPRGQSQPPCHLSMFLEVTDPRSTSPDWSCFVSHRLSVVNQRAEGGEKSVSKESQNRYSKAAKDWGWREFVTLTSLFDQDAGYLVNDAVVFSAEVLVLRESSEAKLVPVLDLPEGLKAADALEYGLALASSDNIPNKVRFSWRIENFVAFKEIMETRKIFSKYFTAEGCELRIGVYESFDTLCIYLESDAQGASLERNFWVKYRIAVVNQKHPERTEWKESAICTKTWNNSVLQFMKVHEMVDAEQGYLHKESLVLMCEVLECCPWFEFADLEVYASDAEGDGVSTDADDLLDSDGSEGGMGDEEELFRSLLARAGVQLGQGHSWPVMLDSKALTAALHDKLLMDATSGAAFLAGMRVYLDDPLKAKRLLLPTVSTAKDGQQTWPCVLDLLMAVHSLQQPLIDLMLDVMVDACECKPRKEQPISAAAAASFVARHRKSVPHLGSSSASDGPSGGASADRATPGLDISRCLPDGRGDGAECASASSTTAGLTSALPSVHSFGSLVGSTSAGEALSMGGPLSTPPSPSPAAKASAGGTKPAASSSQAAAAAADASAAAARSAATAGSSVTSPAAVRSQDASTADSAAASGPAADPKSTAAGGVARSADASGASTAGSAASRAVKGLGIGLGSSSGGALGSRDQSGAQQGPESSPAGAMQPPGSSETEHAAQAAASSAISTPAASPRRSAGSATPTSMISSPVWGGAPSGGRSIDTGAVTPQSSQSTPRRPAGAGGVEPRLQSDASPSASGQRTSGGQPAPASSDTPDSAHASTQHSPVRGLTGEDGQDPASASSAVSGKTAAQDGTWWFGGAGPASGAKDAPAASTSGREKAQYEEVLALAVSWLRTLDPLVCQNGASAGGSAASPRPPAMQKITALLSGLPRALQADMVMLVPKLVDASEHTALAGALLARLAEANREGPEAEVTLRMPVLAALGLLRIDPAIAQKVLRAALESLPALSESELPPAVGLVLKLASDSPKVRSEAVGAVRQRVRSAHAETVTPGTLDALRLAVTQYKEVAQAMLADIDASCKALAKAGRPVSTQDGDSLEAPAALHVADLEVLMDLLAQPSLRRDTERVFEQGVVLGLVSESEVAAVLERRRMQHLVASSMPPPRFSPDLLPQMPFFTPLSYLPNGLPSLPNLPSLGFPWNGLSLPLASGSDFEVVLGLTETLAAARNPAVRTFSAALYSTLFRVFGDDASRERMLRGLIQRAASSASLSSGLSGSESAPAAASSSQTAQPSSGKPSKSPKPSGGNASAKGSQSGSQSSGGKQAAKAAAVAAQNGSLETSPSGRLGGSQSVPASPSRTPSAASGSRQQQAQLQAVPAFSTPQSSAGASGAAAEAQQAADQSGQSGAAKATSAGRRNGNGAADPDATTPTGLLVGLVDQYSSCSKLALQLLLQNMQNATVQIEALQKRITRLEAAQRKAAEQAQQEAAKAAAEAAGLKQKLVEYEVEIARHHSERKTEVAGFSSGKKELQDKIRNLESELDWVRAERADEQAAAAKDKKELTGRVKELESAASRAKTVRRDEVKRLTKEKAQLADRLKELESAQPRLEEELGRLRLAVTSGAEQRQKAEQEAEAKLRKTEGELQQKAEQVKRFEAYVESADAKVRAQQDYIAGLERNLQEQLARVAPLYGANLDALTAGQLDALARIHEEGLKRARTLSAQRRHEEGAAAVAVAAVEAVTGPGNLGNLGNAGNLGPKTSMPASRSGQRNLGSIGSMESVSSVSSMGSLAAASAALGNNDRQGSLAGLGGERLPHGLMDNPSRQSPSRSMFFSGNGNNAFSQQNTPIVSTGFPAGFPNGLLGGTGLMNGHHPSSNGSHQLW